MLLPTLRKRETRNLPNSPRNPFVDLLPPSSVADVRSQSGWSLTGFFSYFNPLWSRHSEEPEEVAEEETSQDEVDTNQSSVRPAACV